MLAKLLFLVAAFIFVAIAAFSAVINPAWGFAFIALGLMVEGFSWNAKL